MKGLRAAAGLRATGSGLRGPKCFAWTRNIGTANNCLRFVNICVFATSLASCLIPQSVDPASSKTHVPPRVVIEAVDPLLATSFVVLKHGSVDAAQGCSCRVLLAVPQLEEDDPTATLEVRWFVDYDPGDPLTVRPAVPSQFLSGSFDSTAVLRQGPTLTFDLAALGVSDGVHVVDMVVAEQGGFDDSSTDFAHRAVLAGYASATFRFVVEVQTDNDSACRGDPPFQRTCAGGGP